MAYGNLGPTHHAVEDLGILRTLPNLTVVAPGDPVETELVTRAIAEIDGPCYLRLGKAGEPVVHRERPAFRLGRAVRLREGRDVALIATGGTLAMTAAAADLLAARGVAARVLSMVTMAPFDSAAVLEAAEEIGRIVTIEEHGVGGLASATAEVLIGFDKPLEFAPLRLPRQVIKDVGSQDHLRSALGLSAENIARIAESL
jgi:transketolase